jgi:hypothetical protein
MFVMLEVIAEHRIKLAAAESSFMAGKKIELMTGKRNAICEFN